MPFEPWMLAAIDGAGYNGIREDHIDAVRRQFCIAASPKYPGRTLMLPAVVVESILITLPRQI